MMVGKKDENVYDNPDSSDNYINLSREHSPPQYGAYDPDAYYLRPPQRHGFRPYQPNYPRGQGGNPPASYSRPGYVFPSYSDPTGGDHMWGEYHGGVDFVSKHRTEWNGVDNESEANMKSEIKKDNSGGTQPWTTFFLIFLGRQQEGKNGKKWDTSVWNDLIAILSEKSTEKVKYNHIKNRLRQMRTEYVNFSELRSKSGVTYDRTKQAVMAPDGFWVEILANSKNQKKYKAFRERGLKWDFEKLSTVIGDSHATGSYSLSGLDKVEKDDMDEGKDDFPSVEENINLEDESMSSASTKKTTWEEDSHG